jgi:hypothetical protein
VRYCIHSTWAGTGAPHPVLWGPADMAHIRARRLATGACPVNVMVDCLRTLCLCIIQLCLRAQVSHTTIAAGAFSALHPRSKYTKHDPRLIIIKTFLKVRPFALTVVTTVSPWMHGVCSLYAGLQVYWPRGRRSKGVSSQDDKSGRGHMLGQERCIDQVP